MAWISTSLGRFDATHHLNGNHVAAVHGDEAEHTCYYQAQHVRLGLPDGEKFLGGGRYDDRLRRTPDGWRFTQLLAIKLRTRMRRLPDSTAPAGR